MKATELTALASALEALGYELVEMDDSRRVRYGVALEIRRVPDESRTSVGRYDPSTKTWVRS
jgi:hypothetical protein